MLHKEQVDQDDDRDPRHGVREDNDVSELAIARQSVVRHQRAALQTFGHLGGSGNVPRL